MDRLIQLIKEKAETLSKITLPDLRKAQFLEHFLNSFELDNIETYNSISKIEYLRAVLLINNINMDFDEFIDTTSLVGESINNPDLSLLKWSGYLNALKKLYDLEILEDCSPNSPKLDENFKALYKKFNLPNFDKSVFTYYPEYVYQETTDDCNEAGQSEFEVYDSTASTAMIKLFKALPDPEVFECIEEVNILKECVDVYYGALEEELDKFSPNREGNKAVNKIKQDVRKTATDTLRRRNLWIFTNCERMKAMSYDIYTKEKDIRTETNRKIGKLKRLHDKLIALSTKTLVSLDNEMKKLLIDKELEYYYMLFILNHNLDIRIVEEYKNIEYNNNSITKLDIIFSKYGLNFNDLDESKQMKIADLDVKMVEEMVKRIRYSELLFITEYSDLFADVLLYSKLHIIQFVDNCIKNKIINKEFVLANINLLFDTEVYQNFYFNLTCLMNAGLNLTNKLIKNVLLLDSSTLTNQLNILGEYKLKLYDESFSNYELFINPKLLDSFDKFIELGYGDIILDNPRYLNEESENMIKRIIISHMIGLSPLNGNKKFIGQITTGNNFYISSSEYDKFIIDYKNQYQLPVCLDILNKSHRNIINVSTKNMPIIKVLDDNFKIDSLRYEIAGITISRKRVMRNLEVLLKNIETTNMMLHDLVFQAILYNMVNNVESEKLEQIYNSICALDIDVIKTYKLS
ncbi:MAG: hypothetical protein E7165_00375 [Firmicutes bacterium]|nr:hypothetical protein [Bacillota bacterium]